MSINVCVASVKWLLQTLALLGSPLYFHAMTRPDLLTLREAAQIAGLSPITLRVQIHRGKLPAKKLGRDWWITRSALNAYIANVSRGSPDAD